MSSAFCFNLGQSKILSSGNELIKNFNWSCKDVEFQESLYKEIGGAFNNASAWSAFERFHSERGCPLRRSIAPASTVDKSFACISKMASGGRHINPFPNDKI